MFCKLPPAAALAVEMHLSMSVQHANASALDLVPLDDLLAAVSLEWYVILDTRAT